MPDQNSGLDGGNIVFHECVRRDLDLKLKRYRLSNRQLGVVSKETLAKELGYSWEIEQEQMQSEGVSAGEEILATLARG